MGRPDVDGLNTGYAALLLEQYLDNPGAVPEEWRDLFESEPEELLQRAARPRAAARARRRRRGTATRDAGRTPPPLRSPRPPPAPAPAVAAGATRSSSAAIAAAMSLVKAFRMHGHLAAHLDPLGSEPPGDPALEPERLIPKLTPELQARIPASLLRLYVEGETLADALPRLREIYMRHDRLRDRAHLRPRGARLAAAGDRVRPLPAAALPRRAGARCSGASARSRGWSATCAAPSSARSSSRSRAST